MKTRHKLFDQKPQILAGLQECLMSFRLSHKARTTIRSSHRSWLTTTAFMHTRWSTERRQNKNCPLPTHPTALSYYLSYPPKYPAPKAGTVSVRLHTTASLTIIHCVQQINWRYIPLHGAMRRHKQKDVSAMMHNEKAATETGKPSRLPISLPYPRSAIRGCEVLFTIHESVLNPFKALSLEHLLPASTFSNPEFLATRCFCILRTILRLYSDFMNSISNRSLWCTHLR
jgi:hypothetical protein